MSTSLLHSDIQTPTLEHFRFGVDAVDHVRWDDKSDERLMWRGRNTGLTAEKGAVEAYWRQGQRQRLVGMFQTGHPTTNGHNVSVLDPSCDGEMSLAAGPLNLELMDIAFADEPIQCDEVRCAEMEEEYKFTTRMSQQASYQYKYVIDVDGNGWSARFKRLMSSRAVVLKSTIHPEWFSDRIQPWVHYVPVKVDFEDVYDIMTFFRGIPSSSPLAPSRRKGAHTDIAREIADAGTEWSETYWRREDMDAYTLRVILEYARIMSEDRDEMDFEYDEIIHGNPRVDGA